MSEQPAAAASGAPGAPGTSWGYVDLQVNGYAGVDFNSDDLDAAGLRKACEAMVRDGVELAVATVITDHIPAMERRLRKLVDLRAQDDLAQKLIPGLHIEGPFINEIEGYRGAHLVDAIHPADADEMRRLLDAGGGLVKIVTLAPERDAGLKVTRMLVDQGVTVSAGHCNPTLDELDAGLDAGVSMFTHLGNGAPMQMHRHDNIIQRALSRSERLHICFIADGVHVPFFALSNYLRAAGTERCVVVSDAMAAAGLGPGRYQLGRWDLQVGEDLAVWAPDRSHLVGSAMTMRQADVNLRTALNLDADARHHLTRQAPLRVLGM